MPQVPLEFDADLSTGIGASDQQFDASPDVAIQAVLAHPGPIFVDLDETLYLRNSTEDFIDLARPALLASLLLRVFDLLRPWRWTGGDSTRDVWRVRLIRFFFPWTSLLWKSQTARLAFVHANKPLIAALKRRAEPPIIVTVGFLPIVPALVAALGFPDSKIVAARLLIKDRMQDKLQSALAALGEDCVRSALLVTDSLHDLTLLRYCSRGVRTVWPDAKYRLALAHVYMPGQYIAQIKHPNGHYLRRAVLQDDYVWWVLSSIALSATPARHIGGLLLLLLSFWSIYETGYVDNDMIAKNFEAQPTLTKAFHSVSVATPIIQPWLWASAFAVGGIYLIRSPGTPLPKDFIFWMMGLAGTALWFTLYNRSNKQARVWMYAGLQYSRTALFVVLVPVMPIGAMALAAHILTRWLQYYVYRLLGKNWPAQTHFGIARLLVFILLGVMLGLTLGRDALWNWTTVALLVWGVVRARKELASVFSKSVRLDRAAPKPGIANDPS